MGVSKLGGAIVLEGVVSPFLAFLECLVLAGVADSANNLLGGALDLPEDLVALDGGSGSAFELFFLPLFPLLFMADLIWETCVSAVELIESST